MEKNNFSHFYIWSDKNNSQLIAEIHVLLNSYFIKIFDKEEYAKKFIKNGEMLISHYSVFRNYEDNSRGDVNDGFANDIYRTNINKDTTINDLPDYISKNLLVPLDLIKN